MILGFTGDIKYAALRLTYEPRSFDITNDGCDESN